MGAVTAVSNSADSNQQYAVFGFSSVPGGRQGRHIACRQLVRDYGVVQSATRSEVLLS